MGRALAHRIERLMSNNVAGSTAGRTSGPVDGPNGTTLWARADRVLPGGSMYLTRSADFAGRGNLPGFIESGDGARVVDADGKSYVDFLCANGPIVLGYAHPEVEEAARHQATLATSASLYPSALIDFVEFMVDRSGDMSWGVTAKNGSDVVALALRVARATTGRNKIIQFRYAYHGFSPEVVSGGAGVPDSHRGHIVWVGWNDEEALAAAVAEHADELAAILINPLEQNPARDTIDLSPTMAAAITSAAHDAGAMVVLDDVRHGLRMHPSGSHRTIGLTPDLICMGKALGNGRPVGLLMGSESARAGARELLFTATFCFEAVALRAAQATVEIYDRDGAFDAMTRAGIALRDGVVSAAERHGRRISWSGPPTMPTMRFIDDRGQVLGERFARAAAHHGAIFHPRLNWFLNAAHDSTAINDAIAAADAAFASL